MSCRLKRQVRSVAPRARRTPAPAQCLAVLRQKGRPALWAARRSPSPFLSSSSTSSFAVTNILLITIPPLVIFLFFNRRIVAGLTAGAVKD
jgi:hypothetical protein